MRFSQLLDRLSGNDTVRGRQFERLCRWFLTHDPRYSFEQVWLWDEWPGRWGPDCGIDLVARDRDGLTWAIQAKCKTGSITKSEIDSFLSESNRPSIHVRLLMASTNKVARNAVRVMKGQGKQVHQILHHDLEQAWLDWPDDLDTLTGGGRRSPRTPRPHQHEAISEVVAGFEANDRGQLLMACGTGKTLTALWIAEALDAEKTLVLLPSLALLSQTITEWTATDSRGMEFLPVCSDESVTGESFTESSYELCYPVTTDRNRIARFVERPGPRVVFATYQSSPEVAAAMEQTGAVFDLAVADEAHRCAGKTSTDFGTILDDNKIRARRRLFMTATPRVFSKRFRQEAGAADVEVASMDDEAVFGPVLHHLGFGEAIDRGLLTDYQVAVIGVDDDTYRRWAEQGERVVTDTGIETDARSLAGKIGLAKAIRRFDLHRVITFHNRIETARRFATTLPEVIDWMGEPDRPSGPVRCEHVSGEMPTGDRIARLDRLRHQEPGEIGVLANARCLSEGVDVPTLDGVAFIQPRRSQVDIVQAVGRAIRLADDKTVGTIVIPVFIHTGDDPEHVLASSAFEPVWSVITALRSHDEALGQELDQLRYRLGRYPETPPGRPPKIIFDLPVGVTAEFARAFDVRLIEATTASWEHCCGLLAAFADREGHARPRREFVTDDGIRLGDWVINQRAARNRGKLDRARVARLEAIDGWSWDLKTFSWERNYRALQAYTELTRVANPPVGFVTDDGIRLGEWVVTQRAARNRGRLDHGRIARLEAIDGWSWDLKTFSWERNYRALQAYTELARVANPPVSFVTNDGYRLGSWVDRQREAYQRGELGDDRAARLEALPGWTWGPFSELWEEGYEALRRYIDREGHARPPQEFKDVNGYKLGGWVAVQRTTYRRGTIDPDRAARLEALPGWTWDPHAETWAQTYRALVAYAKREADARPPTDLVTDDGYKLGQWVTRQRTAHQRGKLDDDRAARLEALPGWTWDPKTDGWKDGYQALRRYIDQEGNARPPYSFVTADGLRLGQWVSRQRSASTGSELAPDRAARLEALPGWTWDPHGAMWEKGYQALQIYADREGHARPPARFVAADGYKLGQWVGLRRTEYKDGTLDPARAARLEAIDGWTWAPFAELWEEGYKALRRYIDREGHARPPAQFVAADGYKLGQWVTVQRSAYKRGTLDPDRAARLVALPGWTWGRRAS